ncbi:cyanophycinase [Idiomarina sp. M1R2S28]|uniref:Cyanophycinase n=1 Tax=Idiomarina rhizosphaerae TaxID=2961572 RepID=A0A9X2FWI7_9GAMM|nr:cyanophycinase [Idiomarina rhizosphaerae]MCP1338920.1 cyanophycinase [Idiomarina rhizosphaerae]
MVRSLFSLLSLAALSSVFTAPSNAADNDTYRHLLLAGGGLKACSSFASDNCDDVDWIDKETMRTDRYLNLSKKFRSKATAESVWPTYREETRKKVADALELIHERLKEDIVPERVFLREFTRRATQQLYNSLSDAEWNRIIDLIELPVPDSAREVVNLDENLKGESKAIFQRFVEMAQSVAGDERKPKVYFLTSASRNPYDKVDFYNSVFEQLGAEVHWLPLDSALVKAQREGRCDELAKIQQKQLGAYERDRVHQDRYQEQVAFCKDSDAAAEMLADADGLFFNDGDQNLTRSTFIKVNNEPGDVLKTIIAAVQQKELVIGGTGAGTAVMTSKPMISNGTTAEAIKEGAIASDPPLFGCDLDTTCPPNVEPDSLTYHPLGGLSLFHYATLDTEFSERGRQGRLMRLAASSSTPLSIGIDENTAMEVNLESGAFNIIGERGAFMVEDAQGTDNAVAATFHYLVAGASGVISPYGLQTAEFAEGDDVIQEEPTTNFLSDRGLIDSMRILCGERKQVSLLNKDFRLIAQRGESSRVQSSGGECQIVNGSIGIAWQPQEQL